MHALFGSHLTVCTMSWTFDREENPLEHLGDEEPLPQVHPDVPLIESLSPIASAFANTKPISNEEALKLLKDFQQGRKVGASARQVERGREAIGKLNATMFRLVLLIAREQVTRRYGVQKVAEMTPDLVQEGSVAITEAAARFD